MLLKISAKKLMPYLLTFLMVALVFVNIPFTTHAAFSGGSGTENDPYLIKTADDLYNMRNNLSANYKLAATIDMSGYKTSSKFFKNGFVPIGDDSTKPFTGSFTCDLGSDGLPLYAILNLKIYNAKGDLYNHDWYGESDYPDALGQDAPYFYQTGLFGNTLGAYIANIYLLNADIYSSVVGQNNGRYADISDASSLISYAAFMDIMGTGALVGAAADTEIYHCAVTGKVDGKTNRHGALIGYALGGSIASSYSDVKVSTGGLWSVGGFIGNVGENCFVSECASFGSLDASMNGYGKMNSILTKGAGIAGGFVGCVMDGVVQDCYTTVTISAESRANSFVGELRGGTVSNAYANADIKGRKTLASGGENASCFISSESTGIQTDFSAVPLKNISKYFSSQSAWNTDGSAPTLKSVNIVTDASIYVAGGERESEKIEVTVPETQSTNQDTTQNTASGSNSQSSTVQNSSSQASVSSIGGTHGNTTADNNEQISTEDTVVEEAGDNTPDIVQLIIIGVLSVMIVGIGLFSVITAINTLKFGRTMKKLYIDSDDNEDEEE